MKICQNNQMTIGPISLTWVLRICWIRTNFEIQEHSMLYKLSPIQKHQEQIWPCHKNGQGQPRVIIWKYMGMTAILVMWPGPTEQTFIRDYNIFWKNHCFTFFSYKSKMGQGQPRVIIGTHLVVLEYQMLHTNFQGHWPFGSREEDFLRFLPYMGMVAILVMWPRPFEQPFIFWSHGGST